EREEVAVDGQGEEDTRQGPAHLSPRPTPEQEEDPDEQECDGGPVDVVPGEGPREPGAYDEEQGHHSRGRHPLPAPREDVHRSERRDRQKVVPQVVPGLVAEETAQPTFGEDEGDPARVVRGSVAVEKRAVVVAVRRVEVRVEKPVLHQGGPT